MAYFQLRCDENVSVKINVSMEHVDYRRMQLRETMAS